MINFKKQAAAEASQLNGALA